MTLVLTALCALLLYVGTALIWPRKPCGRCNGGGKAFSPTGQFHRPCGRCGGDGWLLRIPVVIYNRLRGRRP